MKTFIVAASLFFSAMGAVGCGGGARSSGDSQQAVTSEQADAGATDSRCPATRKDDALCSSPCETAGLFCFYDESGNLQATTTGDENTVDAYLCELPVNDAGPSPKTIWVCGE